MKKVILSLAILAATSFGAFAANDNNSANACKPSTECSDANACGQMKDGKANHGGKKSEGCTANKKQAVNPFEGLNLTDEQKTKLADLRKNCTAGKDKDAKMKDANAQKPELTKEERHKLAAERKAKKLEARKKYLADVKSILTPEQYTQFLENNYLAKDGHKMGSKKGKGGKHFKGHNPEGKKNMTAGKGNRKNSPRKDMKKNHGGMNA